MGGRKAVDLYRVIISVWISIVKSDSHCTPLECRDECRLFLFTCHSSGVGSLGMEKICVVGDFLSHEDLHRARYPVG